MIMTGYSVQQGRLQTKIYVGTIVCLCTIASWANCTENYPERADSEWFSTHRLGLPLYRSTAEMPHPKLTRKVTGEEEGSTSLDNNIIEIVVDVS